MDLREEAIELMNNHDQGYHLEMLLNATQDFHIHKSHTRLLGLKGNEWAAKVIGEEHPLSKDFLNMSGKIDGYFLYKGQDDNDIFIEHIASGRKFNLTKKSFDHSHNLTEIDTIMQQKLTQ